MASLDLNECNNETMNMDSNPSSLIVIKPDLEESHSHIYVCSELLEFLYQRYYINNE